MSAFRRNSKTRRSTRQTNRFGLEPLEAREMMAADFMMAPNLIPISDDGGPIVVGPIDLPDDPVIIDPVFELPPVTPPTLGAKLEGGILTVTGSNEADRIYISAADGMLKVEEVVKGLTLLSVPLASVNQIVVNANGGDDWVNVDDQSVAIPATLRGDWGNDILMGGAGADTIYGGSGNDEMLGRGGSDTMYGDGGDDLMVGGDDRDYMYGGYGNDYLVGGDGNDLMMGEAGDDQMFGENGNDLIHSGDGNNLLSGGAGDDTLLGGNGIDAMYGGDGNDWLRGFAGDDRLRGEGGDDVLDGDEGNDIMDGGIGNDSMDGGAGNDVMNGDLGNDVMAGGAGQDWMNGDAGNDTMHGGDGNDFIMGRSGADTVNGGTGTNSVHQDTAPGYVQYGTTTQSLSWGDVGDFFGDIWDGVVDVFNWTVDRAEQIGLKFYEWVTHIDDRLFSFVGNLGTALSNWPWEKDFWKGLGSAVIDVLELAGLGEAWEIAFEILKPWQRGMTSEEIAVAKSVFGDSIPWNQVRLDEHSLMAKIGRTHVTGYIINSTENLDDRTMIHELTHVWQYVKGGLVYIPEALGGQASDEGYNFGGIQGLRDAMAAGKTLASFNPEQQGEIVASYFDLRQQARTYEANGQIAPFGMRLDLDVYIHFVKQVSTLTAEQLDTPNFKFNPVIVTTTSPVTGGVIAKTAIAPKLVAVGDFNGDLVVDKADYLKLRNQLGTTATPFTGADATGDGLINNADYAIWKQNFGKQVTLVYEPTSEPTTGPMNPGPIDVMFAAETTDPQLTNTLLGTTDATTKNQDLLLLATQEAKTTDATKVTSTTTTRTAETTKSLQSLDLAFESWGL